MATATTERIALTTVRIRRMRSDTHKQFTGFGPNAVEVLVHGEVRGAVDPTNAKVAAVRGFSKEHLKDLVVAYLDLCHEAEQAGVLS